METGATVIARIGLVVAALVAASPAIAQTIRLDLPAGRVGDAVRAIGERAGVSIAVADPALWAAPVPRIRGRWTAAAALARVAATAHARVERVGDTGFRLVPAAKAVARKAPRPRVSPPVVDTSEPAGDVVVVASKRDLPLARLAAQATRVDGAILTLGGVGGSDRLIQRIASVSSTYLGAGRNKLFIRGIADSSFTGPTQTTVGQYFGDLRMSYNAPDPDLRLSDLAAVEVLEGPQGTLYGAGSLGGVIRLVPNVPELGVTRGNAMLGGSLTEHGSPGADANMMLNLPIVDDRAALRIVADASSEGGYIDKPALGRRDVNRTRIAGGRGTIRVDLGAGWTADLIGFGQRTRGADSQYADRDGPPLTRAAQIREPFSADYVQGQFVLSGSLGAIRLRSSTGIGRQDLTERYDATDPFDGTPRILEQRNRTRLFAHETRAWQTGRDGSGWLVGISYTDNRADIDRAIGPPDAPSATTGFLNHVDELTLYGQGSLALGHGLLATAGGRATRSILTGNIGLPFVRIDAIERIEWIDRGDPIASVSRLERRTETAFLPSASLLATLAPHASLYARYEEGFRPGGSNAVRGTAERFSGDRVRTIEVGARYGRPGIERVDLAGSIAYTRWTDIQADYLTELGFPITVNAGDGRLWTAAVTAGVTPVKGLRIEASGAYNDSDVTPRPIPFRVAVLTGPVELREIPNVARLTGRLGATYEAALCGGLSLRADGWARYVGRSRPGIGDLLGELQGDYLDSGVTVRFGRPRFGVTLGATNLADTIGDRFSLGTPFPTGRGQVTPLRPRTIRLGFDAAF